MAVTITKYSGERVPYDEEKVRESIRRTGAGEKAVEAVLKKVATILKDGVTTREIYDTVREELRAQMPWAAARYGLRQAIGKLGPAGFNFEKYVASVLNAYGYRAETPDTYMGACIRHEVDVTAEKEGRTAFIEAKFRHDFRSTITIKDTLATWARYLDLVDGARIGQCPHFDEAWIVTNARFTDQSLQYGHCKNMMLIGWNHPKERSFAKMVDLDALYPITALEDLSETELHAFASADMILCREVSERDPAALASAVGLPMERTEAIIKACVLIVNGDAGKEGPELDETAAKR